MPLKPFLPALVWFSDSEQPLGRRPGQRLTGRNAKSPPYAWHFDSLVARTYVVLHSFCTFGAAACLHLPILQHGKKGFFFWLSDTE